MGIEEELRMAHETVNHSLHFVDPDTGVDTNTIKGIWNGLKIGIPPRNRATEGLDQRIMVRIWRKANADDLWAAFLTCLREIAYN